MPTCEYKQIQHVRFFSYGQSADEVMTRKVASRNSKDLEMPPNAFAIQYFTETQVNIEGSWHEVPSASAEEPGRHYLRGQLMTREEVEQKLVEPQLTTARSCLQKAYDRVIKIDPGTFRTFGENDCLGDVPR